MKYESVIKLLDFHIQEYNDIIRGKTSYNVDETKCLVEIRKLKMLKEEIILLNEVETRPENIPAIKQKAVGSFKRFIENI